MIRKWFDSKTNFLFILILGAAFLFFTHRSLHMSRPHKIIYESNNVYFVPSKNSSVKRLPSCIVIGVRKGGTRALIDMIGLHSKVKPAKNEVHFFDVNDNYEKGYEWYREQMPLLEHADEIAIEKTPSYFNTPLVPPRIKEMRNKVHLLLVVRDPVTRLISDYTQILQNHREKNLAFKAFEDLTLNTDGTVNTKYDAVKKSMYVLHMRRWLKHFPMVQIHVVNGDKFIRKPWQELKKVEDFLGLENEITRELFYFNATKGFHCVQWKSKDRCLTKSKGRPHPNVSKAAVIKLRKFYAKYNYQFYNLVGQDFGWPEE